MMPQQLIHFALEPKGSHRENPCLERHTNIVGTPEIELGSFKGIFPAHSCKFSLAYRSVTYKNLNLVSKKLRNFTK